MDLEKLDEELTDLQDALEQTKCETEENRIRRLNLEQLAKDLGKADLWQAANDLSSLIPETEFEKNVQEYAIESQVIDKSHKMFDYIDWKSYANDLQSSFESVTFEGVTYYYY